MAVSTLPRYTTLTTLPEGYREVRRITIDSAATLLYLNLWGVGLLVVGLGGFALWGLILTQAGIGGGIDLLAGWSGVAVAVALFVTFVLMLSIHELVHGVAFRLFGAKPTYGVDLKKGVAYASAAKYYLSRDAYIIVGLAPLFVLTALFFLLALVTGGGTRALFLMIGGFHVGGCVGDVWFWLVCRRYPPHLLIRDFGDGAALFMPQTESETAAEPLRGGPNP